MTVFSLFFLASTSVFALTINSLEDVVQCQRTLITWSDGVAPYNLSICPANLTGNCTAPLVNLGTEYGTSCQWTVNLPAGVSAVVDISDFTGQNAQSSSFTVQLGSDNSCLNSTGTDTTTSLSASAATTSGTTSPASGSFAAVSSPSTAAAASHYAPVKTLFTTGVTRGDAALTFALVLLLLL